MIRSRTVLVFQNHPDFKQLLFVILGVVLVINPGCSNSQTGSNQSKPDDVTPPKITWIKPGPDAAKELQTALIMAEEGEIIDLAEGKYEFVGTISLDVPGVTLRGQGMDKTILNFQGQQAGTGGEGLSITSGRFTLTDLAVEDTRGDAVKINGVTGVTLRRVRAEWTNGADKNNGAYGLYPVLCKDVLIEDCVARGASDSGIYVGQSENIIVRRNKVIENVAGIEIENSVGADVYENEATDNSGGILVFTLPDLVKKNGHNCRLFNNKVHDNNHTNFAPPGSIVGQVPPGTGIMIMANDNTEVFSNTVENNQTANLVICSYLVSQRPIKDPEYDPYPETIHIHGNTFSGGGDKPAGELGLVLKAILGKSLPDIVYDGAVDDKKQVEGKLPDPLKICIHDNGDADFVNFDIVTLIENLDIKNLLSPKKGNLTRDLSSHQGTHPSLKPITIPGVY